MKITFAITVCNEIQEIKRLLSFLFKNKRDNDDIVVLFDTKNGTQEVENYLSNVIEPNFLYFKDEFENHFGCWKNKLKNLCKGDYIFFIDADEIPNLDFFLKLPNILKEYPNNDLFYIPRINTVKGLTESHIIKWKMNVKNNWINFPDYQVRLIKNLPYIFWTNAVHEVITGFKNPITLPPKEDFSLYHEKEIQRQEKQNDNYDKIAAFDFSNRLNIIYRTCDSVSVTSNYNQKRDFGTKSEIIIKCFDSLVKALKVFNGEYRLYVVNDHVSERVKSHLESYNIITKLFNLDKGGNGQSFIKCLDINLECFGNILFLEDDYYLNENIFNEMIFFKTKTINTPKFTHKHICLYPLDEDNYNKPELCYVMTGKSHHWKTVTHTTCTFMIDDFILKDQLQNLQRFGLYGSPGINEDNTINLVYKKFPCFSPLPSLVEHMQYYNCLSPFSKFKKEKL